MIKFSASKRNRESATPLEANRAANASSENFHDLIKRSFFDSAVIVATLITEVADVSKRASSKDFFLAFWRDILCLSLALATIIYLFIYLFIHREQGAVSVLSVVDVDP
jgi:hypothetical protein